MGNDGKTPNVIPTSRLSPQALSLLNNFIPRVGGAGPCVPLAGATGAQNNVVCSGVGTVTSDAFDVRIDRYQTQKINMFGLYSLQQFQLGAPGPLAQAGDRPSATFRNISFAQPSLALDSM